MSNQKAGAREDEEMDYYTERKTQENEDRIISRHWNGYISHTSPQR